MKRSLLSSTNPPSSAQIGCGGPKCGPIHRSSPPRLLPHPHGFTPVLRCFVFCPTTHWGLRIVFRLLQAITTPRLPFFHLTLGQFLYPPWRCASPTEQGSAASSYPPTGHPHSTTPSPLGTGRPHSSDPPAHGIHSHILGRGRPRARGRRGQGGASWRGAPNTPWHAAPVPPARASPSSPTSPSQAAPPTRCPQLPPAWGAHRPRHASGRRGTPQCTCCKGTTLKMRCPYMKTCCSRFALGRPKAVAAGPAPAPPSPARAPEQTLKPCSGPRPPATPPGRSCKLPTSPFPTASRKAMRSQLARRKDPLMAAVRTAQPLAHGSGAPTAPRL